MRTKIYKFQSYIWLHSIHSFPEPGKKKKKTLYVNIKIENHIILMGLSTILFSELANFVSKFFIKIPMRLIKKFV